jgi:putative DNA primase/helicase
VIIQKSVKATVERMRKFETYEFGCAESAYESLSDKSGGVEEVLTFILQKRYIQDCGALAALFECFMDFAGEYSQEERKKTEVVLEKYHRYAAALKDRYAYPRDDGNDYLDREAYYYIFKRDETGVLKLNEGFNARMMAEDHGDGIRYVGPWKKWLIWDDSSWKIDQSGGICRLAQETLKRMRNKAALLPLRDETSRLMDHAGRSETVHKIKSMVETTSWKFGIAVLPEDLDSDPWLFNCANGFIDCRSGRLFPHERRKLMTMISPVAYDPEARCPEWQRFLTSIFKGNKQLIRFVQKAMGTCLTGDTSIQSMFILYGTGANGKSTFMNAVMNVLGNYAITTPTETFLQKKGDQPTNDVARLKGKRFVSAMESELGGRLAEAMVKRLTGDDVISARFLYGEYFEFKPTFKIVMATNHKPKVGGMDEAIWRRLKLIPFEVTIPPEKQDRHLSEKLEKELPGILAWMVEGCLLWLTEGLGHVDVVDRALKEYRGQMSAIEAFIESECIRDINGRVKIADMYQAFVSWCEENHERVISKRAFGMRLDEMNVAKYRDSDTWYRVGWRLNR